MPSSETSAGTPDSSLSAAAGGNQMVTGQSRVEGVPRGGRGRPRLHRMRALRRTMRELTTRRLDGRSAVAVALRRWKEDVRRDLGGDLTRAQETLLELAAQAWVIVSSLDDWIARQSSLVTKKRRVLDVVLQRQQLAEGLARNLDRLGLDRKAKPVPDLTAYLAERTKPTEPAQPQGGGGGDETAPEVRHNA